MEELELVPSKADPSLYFSFTNDELCGVIGSYVDDILLVGAGSFREISAQTYRLLEGNGDVLPLFTFAKFYLARL